MSGSQTDFISLLPDDRLVQQAISHGVLDILCAVRPWPPLLPAFQLSMLPSAGAPSCTVFAAESPVHQLLACCTAQLPAPVIVVTLMSTLMSPFYECRPGGWRGGKDSVHADADGLAQRRRISGLGAGRPTEHLCTVRAFPLPPFLMFCAFATERRFCWRVHALKVLAGMTAVPIQLSPAMYSLEAWEVRVIEQHPGGAQVLRRQLRSMGQLEPAAKPDRLPRLLRGAQPDSSMPSHSDTYIGVCHGHRGYGWPASAVTCAQVNPNVCDADGHLLRLDMSGESPMRNTYALCSAYAHCSACCAARIRLFGAQAAHYDSQP